MNSLAACASPYLLQHRDNPVEWYPWGEEAFERARSEQKPVFLSIGYSTCHWCHVMAHESFESHVIARVMNDHFINVKVDREERPDVDRLYMAYVQGLTGSGGWPMSVWLTPELKPFFGGTYFPPEDRHGRAGFRSILLQVARLWNENRGKILHEAARSVAALHESTKRGVCSMDDLQMPLEKASEYFQRIYDIQWGGFGSEPKFPRPSVLFFLLRRGLKLQEKGRQQSEYYSMTLGTLDRMAAGGIHDHLGGGFHRYSVDRLWHVPHFEKMLYDQAQLAVAYLEAWQITGKEKYREIVRDILSYVLRERTSSEGGFYSAEDADSLVEQGSSEHAEGAFFVWTKDQIEEALDTGAAALFCEHYGIRKEGNVDSASDPHCEFSGKNILMEQHSVEETASRLGIPKEIVATSLLESKKILLGVRSSRPRPHSDDKILCAWNGLMISALAKAGTAFGDKAFLAAAERASEHLRNRLVDPVSGELRRSWCEGRFLKIGFAEDYAFLIQGLIDLYEASFSIRWLQWAAELQQIMDRLFWDEKGGGYYSSAEGDANLLLRIKEDYDGAEPSANSVAALNLLRFSRMLGDQDAGAKAGRIFELSSTTLREMPAAVPQLLVALEYSLTPGRQIVVAGISDAPDTSAIVADVRRGFNPDQVLLLADGGDGQKWLVQRVPALADMKPINGRAALYRCDNFTCTLPSTGELV